MTLDPTLSRLLDSISLDVALPVDWPVLRATAASLLPIIRGSGSAIKVNSVQDAFVEGADGPVPLRIYRPTAATSTVVHYVHGGGWALGDLDTVDHTMRHMCEAIPAVMVASTYRLAPEHPFPAAFEDTLAASRWVIAHARELGGRDARAAIAGDSAGGNLAAAVAIALAAENTGRPHPLAAQLLLYPPTDLRDDSWSNTSRIADADPTLQGAVLRAFADFYAVDADRADWRLSPLAAADLTGLPPALIIVLSVDPLRDEAVAYAERLQSAGVVADLLEFDNLTHGFNHLRQVVPAAADATDVIISHFRRILELSQPTTAD